ncbi:MATE family efflux transporter [Pseudoalteromonas piscicida]|uniref:Polysaccharide biosynthesis protein C-terminal domain-containing protein n=1 Tax=Pseudoalteromonas piscicida TaxID=43662 RepID=A0A2A5JVY6_PSEO7|nr:MATE family efflux transporter [Pseudoalteromonas piscicida]PCK33632.1 hypothetical protein CEX98_01035 [Pseudoalteromonas piscicida]
MLVKSALVLFIKVLGAALSFFWIKTITSNLGASDAGTYLFWISTITVLSSGASLGLNNISLKEVSILYGKKDFYKISALVHKSVFLIFLASAIIVAFLYLALFLYNEHISKYQIFFLVSLPFLTIIALLSHAIQGSNGLYSSMIAVALIQPIALIAAVSLNLVHLTLESFSMLFLIINIAIFIISYVIWLIKCNFVFCFEYSAKTLILAGSSLLVYQLVQQFNTVIGQMLLGFYKLDKEVAIFAVCIKVASLLSFITFSVNRIVAPNFAIFYESNDISKLKNEFEKAKKLMLLGVLPLIVFCLVFPKYILSFFGSEFPDYALILQLLIFQQLFVVLCGPSTYLIVMTGGEKRIRNQVLLSSFFGTLIGVIGVPFLGIYGAVIASFSATFISQILSFSYLRHKLSINILRFW